MVGRRANATSATPKNVGESSAAGSTKISASLSLVGGSLVDETTQESLMMTSKLLRGGGKDTATTSSWIRKHLRLLGVWLKGLNAMQRVAVGFLALCLGYMIHRTIVNFKSSQSWVMSPAMYTERPCPAPPYQTLLSTEGGRQAAAKLKICLTTLTDEKTKDSVSWLRRKIRWRDYDNILELTWESKQAYAKKHGYHLFDSSDLVQQGRPVQWSKIVAVQRLFNEERCDWVLWMDADTLFMNSNKKVEELLPADPNVDLLVAVDVPNPGYNSGSWLIHNSEWGRSFLQKWWDMKSFVRLPGQSLSGDNDAFKVLLASYNTTEFATHVGVPPRCSLNAFAKFLRPWQPYFMTQEKLQRQPWYLSENFYHKGDWLVHVPGYDNKMGVLQMLLKEIQ